VIATGGGTPPAIAAKGATSTIPIVFYLGVDPVQFGLVASLNRPGGNMTGIVGLQADLAAKRVELLRELVPSAAAVALLVNPTNPYTESEARAVLDAARDLGLQIHVIRASTAADIDAVFNALARPRTDALLINADLSAQPARAARRTGRPTCAACGLRLARVLFRWRHDVLYPEPRRRISPGRAPNCWYFLKRCIAVAPK
jgi:ABC-type uncharacterized transport system substrate-binding protein